MSTRSRRAAFFDMDRTVLRIDTGTSWMRFLYRRGELSHLEMARALYWSALYKVALLDLEVLARRLVADLRGDSEQEMIDKARIWHQLDVAHQVAPAARRTIEDHRDRGDLVVMLTGSTQYAAEVVSASLDIEHTLCSRLEVRDGVFTGHLAQLCFGHHKVTLAEDFARREGVDLSRSVFYSDSYNDLPMLERVGTAVAVNPDARLHRHARRAGWRVENWLRDRRRDRRRPAARRRA
jgi:HAD superfamily hydrolase (TIGR01490 family)